MARFVLLIPWLLILSVNSELPQQLVVSKLNTEDALVQNTVYSIHQDEKGFMWFATQGGFSFYDGYSLKGFRTEAISSTTYLENQIFDLTGAVDGSMYIGNKLGISTFDPISRKIEQTWIINSPGVSFRNIHNIYFDQPFNRLWVSTDQGLLVYDTVFKEHDVKIFENKQHTLLSREKWKEHIVTLIGHQYLTIFDVMGKVLYKLDLPNDDRLMSVTVHQNSIYIVGQKGLYHWRPESGFQTLFFDENGFGGTISHLNIDKEGRAWFVIDSVGIAVFSLSTKEFVIYNKNNSQLPSNSVVSLFIDKNNILWLGMRRRGVRVVNLNDSMFEYFRFETDKNETDKNAIRQFESINKNELLISTDDGLGIFNLETDALTVIDAPAHKYVADEKILYSRSLLRKDERYFWMGTRSGLFLFDTQKKSLSMVEWKSPDEWSYPRVFILSMIQDDDGNLWMGTNKHGLLKGKMKDGKLDVSKVDLGKSHNTYQSIMQIYEDRKGRVWLGTSHGVILVDNLNSSERLIRRLDDVHSGLAVTVVRSIYEDAYGDIWLGTHSGLYQVSELPRQQFSVKEHSKNAGFSDSTIYAVLSDQWENLWVSSNLGITRYSPRTNETAINYDDINVLRQLEFDGDAAFVDRKGRLYFGGMTGFNRIIPNNANYFNKSDEVIILELGYGENFSEKVYDFSENIVLQHDQNSVSIRFALNNLNRPAKNEYRYRMIQTEEWQILKNRNEINLIGLRPGDYQLNIQGRTEDGQWGVATKSVRLTIQEIWWLRWQALLGYAILISILLFYIAYLSYRRKKEQVLSLNSITESRNQLKLALWGSGDGLWNWDVENESVNRINIESLLGDRTMVIPTHINALDEFIHYKDLPHVKKLRREFLNGRKEGSVSYRIKDAFSNWLWIEEKGRVVNENQSGKTVNIAGIYRDITIAKRAELNLKVSEQIIRNLNEAVVVANSSYKIQFINPAFSQITKLELRDVASKDLNMLRSSSHSENFYQIIQDSISKTGIWKGETWIKCRDNNEILCALEAFEMVNPVEHTKRVVLVFSDITEKRKAEDELLYLARYDTLTSLPNRVFFIERLEHALARARRRKLNLAVMFLDLDGFKLVNDSLGHFNGDLLLATLSKRLKKCQREEDTLARLGGDEFVILIEQYRSDEDIDIICHRLLSVFKQSIKLGEHEVVITGSIGISQFPQDGENSANLMMHADKAMYKAKDGGKNQYCFYSKKSIE